jgi:hypothetical protein
MTLGVGQSSYSYNERINSLKPLLSCGGFYLRKVIFLIDT